MVRDSLTGSQDIKLISVDYVLGPEGTTSASLSSTTLDVIDEFIKEKSAEFNAKCNRYIIPVSVSGLYAGDGCNELILREDPIISVSSIQHRTSLTASWTTITNAVDIVDGYKIVLPDYTFIYSTFQNYKITYVTGITNYDNDSDLKGLIRDMVRIKLRESNLNIGSLGMNILGQKTRQADGVVGFNTSFDDLSVRESKLLERYERPIFVV